jgi:hypothetical protein
VLTASAREQTDRVNITFLGLRLRQLVTDRFEEKVGRLHYFFMQRLRKNCTGLPVESFFFCAQESTACEPCENSRGLCRAMAMRTIISANSSSFMLKSQSSQLCPSSACERTTQSKAKALSSLYPRLIQVPDLEIRNYVYLQVLGYGHACIQQFGVFDPLEDVRKQQVAPDECETQSCSGRGTKHMHPLLPPT